MSKKHKHKYNKVFATTQKSATQVPVQTESCITEGSIDEGDRVLVVYEEESTCSNNDSNNESKSCYVPYANLRIPVPSHLNKVSFKHIREATIIKIIKERVSSCGGYAMYDTYALIEYYNPSRVYERVPIDCVYKLDDKDKADLECVRYNFKCLTTLCFNLIDDLQSMQKAYSKTQNELNARITALEKKYAE